MWNTPPSVRPSDLQQMTAGAQLVCMGWLLEISDLARATTPYGSTTRVLALPPYRVLELPSYPYQFSEREAKATYADVVKEWLRDQLVVEIRFFQVLILLKESR